MNTQRVKIRRIVEQTPEIRSYELVPCDGSSVKFTPGDHIDVCVGDGIVRQYSLWNAPRDCDAYHIGVKRETNGRGGSAAMHALNEGDEIEVGLPRNNFELRSDEGPVILIAGGIGITPVLAMARHLQSVNRKCVLHLFARSAEHVPFKSELTALDEAPVYLGLVPPTLNAVLTGILSNPPADARLYFCGPGPFMDLIEQLAKNCGWKSDRVHLERFSVDAATLELDGDSFEVVLQKSGVTLTVEEDQTIIGAMEAAGLEPMTSCEQGVCGTCLTTVLEGEPDHRDFYLNPTEKESGTLILPCVSRCKGKKLVLDL
ncbi:MAG: PDR/VanB family oxidoreductase [Gluconobacter cerinus]|uniref:PDR/VanB family oxidoreductase n=1 Tax=Gluconobacter cerinus TaxID=38307 RepID=UPI0039ED66CF